MIERSSTDIEIMKQIIETFNEPILSNEFFIAMDAMLSSINIDTHDAEGLYFLHHSTSENKYIITEFLLGKGANPNVQNCAGETPLLQTARRGNLDLVKLLIAHGANPDIYDNNQDSPLLWAAYHGHLDVVIFLVQNDADLYHQYKDGRNAIRWAIREKHFATVKYLSEFIKDISCADTHGQTMFEIATTDEIKELLKAHIEKNKIVVLRYMLMGNSALKEFRIINMIGEFYSP